MNNDNKQPVRRPLALALVLAMLGGCVNYQPVRDFAAETRSLTDSFEPMLAASHESCMAKYQRKKMITSRSYDPHATQRQAMELCAPVAESNKSIAAINALLRLYGETLLLLADGQANPHRGEIQGLEAALDNLRDPATDERLISEEQARMVGSLSELLTGIVTRHRQREGLRELVSHQDEVDALVLTLDTWVQGAWQAWLRDEKRELKILLRALDGAGDERLASNYLKETLLQDQATLEARQQGIERFKAALQHYRQTNASLGRQIDELDSLTLAAELRQLHREVTALTQAVDAAF